MKSKKQNQTLTFTFKSNLPHVMLESYYKEEYPRHNVEIHELVNGSIQIVLTPKNK